MSKPKPFLKIAVIGAGTMGGGIAAQIANAGLPVLLLDLPARIPGAPNAAELAIDKLLASDPPQLMHRRGAKLIQTGTIEDDFDKLADCDWIIEAVIEQLPVKKALYKRLNQTISEDCIITSNTSTIPIALLSEDMPVSFCRRFAITHYFNPVRFMRLLELVRGAHTDDEVIERLADFNDHILGKGVVKCQDKPGFLGNRVGVYALQVGLHEALNAGMAIADADAIIGRPFGIPKTGIFGLYDLIGIDLMSDVASSLRSILPDGDDFHHVGDDPELVTKMIADGYIGNKGKGGFYRENQGQREVRVLGPGASGEAWQIVPASQPICVGLSAQAQARQQEPLDPILADDSPAGLFAKRVLARILGYAAGLIPKITDSPQDIDDAMKLGFNWQRGPFELIDAIGIDRLKRIAKQVNIHLPDELLARTRPYYKVHGDHLHIDRHSTGYTQLSLPNGAMRFSMMRRYTEVLATNNAASCYRLDGDLRLIEFHSKANALNDLSMQIVNAATKDSGRGIIVHNDAQHFSAGVDLNHFQQLIKNQDWSGIDLFLGQFQQAVKALKYCNVPVIGAPSGLAVGGGFEVLLHCDRLCVHANSTLGLVEAGVGLVPSGGGVKESYLRWYRALGDWDEAAWQTWMQIGYGATGSSPEQSKKYKYFLPEHDLTIMNRDRLLPLAMEMITGMQESYHPPSPPVIQLGNRHLIEKMDSFMQEGVDKGDFTPHNKQVAMMIASIIVADQDEPLECDEQALYDRERRAFLRLAKTQQTASLIDLMLNG